MVTRPAILGRLLLDGGAVTADALASALDEQRESGRRLGEILVGKGLADGELVARARGAAGADVRGPTARVGALSAHTGAAGSSSRPTGAPPRGIRQEPAASDGRFRWICAPWTTCAFRLAGAWNPS